MPGEGASAGQKAQGWAPTPQLPRRRGAGALGGAEPQKAVHRGATGPEGGQRQARPIKEDQ